MLGEYLALIVGAVLVNNFVLSRILGICPFLGVSKKPKTALGMGGAVIFVMTLSGLVTSLIHHCVLKPCGMEYLRTIVFILVIAALVQIVEVLLQRFSPALYKALGIYLPLITTNCAVLYVALDNITQKYNLIETIVNSIAVPAGFMLVLVIFATIRERLAAADVPEAWKGNPIALVVAAIMAIAFSAFAGLV